jgi:hypothetical protein
MLLLEPDVLRILSGGDVALVEDRCRCRLLRVLAPGQLLARLLVVLAPALVVGVTAGTGPAHLEELAGHVRTGEVYRLEVCEEHLVYLGRRLLRLGHGLEAPVREEFALVRLDQQHSLLALPDPV